MARQKNQSPTVEEQIREQADAELSAFLGEEVVDGKVVEEEVTEEKPEVEQEEKPEEKKEETPEPEKVETPQFDADKFKNELLEEVKKLVPAATPEAEQEQKDELEEFLKSYEEKDELPTWRDASKFFLSQAQKQALKAYEEAKQADIEREEEAKRQQEEATRLEEERQKQVADAINSQIDDELSDLYSSGKIPRIKNEKDPEDIGVKARKALFQSMLEVNEERVKSGRPIVTSIKTIFYEHYKAPAEPAGADAPISMGNGTAPEVEDDEYSYDDIHGARGFEDILMRRK